MYAAPLVVVPTIISKSLLTLGLIASCSETKDSSCMPPLYSLTGMVSATVWFGYGLASHDTHVAVPNGSGAVSPVTALTLCIVVTQVLCAVQLVIWAIYRVAKSSQPSSASSANDYVHIPESVKSPEYIRHCKSTMSESTVCSLDYLLLDP